jgi:hypothetical protein
VQDGILQWVAGHGWKGVVVQSVGGCRRSFFRVTRRRRAEDFQDFDSAPFEFRGPKVISKTFQKSTAAQLKNKAPSGFTP